MFWLLVFGFLLCVAPRLLFKAFGFAVAVIGGAILFCAAVVFAYAAFI